MGARVVRITVVGALVIIGAAIAVVMLLRTPSRPENSTPQSEPSA